MLQAMRQNMKVILWVTVIFFVLLIFLVWGADLQGGKGPRPNVAGTVNGEPVSISTYQQLLANARQNARTKGQDLQPSDELRIEEDTWTSLVNEILVRQEAARRGLQARDAEVRAVLLNSPPAFITQNPSFQNDQGQFDLAAYRSFLQDPATPEAVLIQLESYVKNSLPQQKLQQMVMTGAKVTEDELRRVYRDETERADITYVLVEAAGMDVEPAVTDDEVETYYNAHPAEYTRPKTVDLLYYSIPRVPTPQDSLDLKKEITEFAEQARRADQAAREGAENLSDSDFATLASTFSDLPSAENGGLDSNYVTPARVTAQVNKVLSGLEVGEISDPFQDGGFLYIVKLVDKKMQKGAPAYQLRYLGLRIAPSDSTVYAIEEKLESIRDQARQKGLREVLGLDVREAEGVVRGRLVPGLTGLPSASEFAHDNPPGTVSRVLATNTAWYILEVGEVHPEGVQSLREVRSRVVSAVVRSRRMDAARALADSVAQRVQKGETLEAAADTFTVTPATGVTRRGGVRGLGREPHVLAAAFSLPVGQTSRPLEASRGWVVLRVDNRPEMDWKAFEARKQFLMQVQRSARQSQVLNAFLDDLRRKADIVDYRT